jgi:hypothetical protein
MKKFEIIISSPPDREFLVAEIWDGDKMVAEINQEKEHIEVEIYISKDKNSISLDLDPLLDALIDAKKKLINR